MRYVGGYRLVRALGGGSRAEVWLGRNEHMAADGAAAGAAEPPLVAVKLFRRGVAMATIDAEVEALTRVTSRHVMALFDLTSDADGQVALLGQRLRPGGLPRLLTGRSSLAVGEVVTILAPIALTLGALHSAGAAHGGLGPTKVLFDDAGAPVLVGFGNARFITARGHPSSPAMRGASEAIADDRARLAAMARGLLLHTGAAEEAAVERLLAWLPENIVDTSDRFANDLADRLFDLAEPVPVAGEITADTAPSGRPLPASRAAVPPRGTAEAGATSDGGDGPGRGLPPWLLSLGLPEWVGDVVQAVLNAVASGGIRGRMRAAAAGIRRRYLVLAAGTAIVVVAAIVVAGVADGVPTGGVPITGGSAVGAVPAPDGGAEAGEARPAAGTHDTLVAESAADAEAIAGDDPVAAAVALMRLRATCLADLSVLCLDGVDHMDSAAWEADQHTIRSAQESGVPAPERVLAEGGMALIDRMGDTAIVSLGRPEEASYDEPASVLMIRTEAGWRIRDVLDG